MVPPIERYNDIRPAICVADGIPYDILQCARNQFPTGVNSGALSNYGANSAIPRRCFVLCVLDNLFDDVLEMNHLLPDCSSVHRFHSRQFEQLADQTI